jgi:hypothetical protein
VHQTEGSLASPEDLATEVATLRDAIATRTIIGQATGLLAGQLGIPTYVAWRVMRRLSNETNIKLRDIARALVDAHDGRRSPEDVEIGRAIGAALGAALSAAREEGDTLVSGPADGAGAADGATPRGADGAADGALAGRADRCADGLVRDLRDSDSIQG